MAECADIAPMLSSYADSELEPREMRDVERHLESCRACRAECADYRAIADQLRMIAPDPPLEGFAAAVMERIERLDRIRHPLAFRLKRFLAPLAGRMSRGVPLAGMAAAAAIITAVVITPYATGILRHETEPQMIVRARPQPARHTRVPTVARAEPERLATAALSEPQLTTGAIARSTLDVPPLRDDSRVFISKLETAMPSVAVWSEPQTGTMVIWLPDQR